jgi:hypothetical protein
MQGQWRLSLRSAHQWLARVPHRDRFLTVDIRPGMRTGQAEADCRQAVVVDPVARQVVGPWMAAHPWLVVHPWQVAHRLRKIQTWPASRPCQLPSALRSWGRTPPRRTIRNLDNSACGLVLRFPRRSAGARCIPLSIDLGIIPFRQRWVIDFRKPTTHRM